MFRVPVAPCPVCPEGTRALTLYGRRDLVRVDDSNFAPLYHAPIYPRPVNVACPANEIVDCFPLFV